MLVNITEYFIESGREWQVGQNPDVPREVAAMWIADGKATADTDGARNQSPVSGGGIGDLSSLAFATTPIATDSVLIRRGTAAMLAPSSVMTRPLLRPNMMVFGDSITQYASENIAFTSLTQSGGVASGVLASAHGMWPGCVFNISGLSSGTAADYCNLFQVATVPTATSITFDIVETAPASAGGTPRLIQPNAIVGNNSYWNWAQALSKHRMNFLGNLGVSGDTTTSLISRLGAISRAQEFYADTPPSDIYILVGVNDINAGSTSATIKANLQQIYEYVLNLGMRLHVATIMGSTAFTSAQAAIVCDVNEWIKEFASQNPSAYLYDFYAITCDNVATTGNPISASMTGNVHPAPAYARLLGQYMADRWEEIYSPTPGLLPSSYADSSAAGASSQILANPTFIGAAGATGGASGTAPTSWTIYNPATNSSLNGAASARTAVVDGDVAGYNEVLTAVTTGFGTTNLYQSGLHTQLSAGDEIVAMASVGISGNTNVDGVGLLLSVTVGGIAYTSICGLRKASTGTTNLEDGLDVAGMVFETPAIKIPAGTITAAVLYLQVTSAAGAGGYTVKWGRAGVRKM